MNDFVTELTKCLAKIAYTHSSQEVFNDFTEMVAVSISNSVDTSNYTAREAQYLHTIKKYDTEQQQLFAEAFALLVEALDKEATSGQLTDLLGNLFMDLKCGDTGQFFTPQHICTMMGKLSLSEPDKAIETKGFISLMEPCCGAGAMVLGVAQAVLDAKYDHTRQMVVTAVDTDIRCVHMCYVQLALYGIPAVVIHGDSLTMKERSRWYTPLYILHGWKWRQHCGMTELAKNPVAKDGPEKYEQLNLFKEEN